MRYPMQSGLLLCRTAPAVIDFGQNRREKAKNLGHPYLSDGSGSAFCL